MEYSNENLSSLHAIGSTKERKLQIHIVTIPFVVDVMFLILVGVEVEVNLVLAITWSWSQNHDFEE